MLNIKLFPQEGGITTGEFTGFLILTDGFRKTFANDAEDVAMSVIRKIIKERVETRRGADSIQGAIVNNKKFLVIDDVGVVTCLMPEEY